jgi:GNAT superfamily N-acetyltransferase
MNADRAEKRSAQEGFGMQRKRQASPSAADLRDDYVVHTADLDRDAPEIIDFWVSQFPNWKTSKYRYFYIDNPDGRAVCWLVREKLGNKVVGTLAILQRMLSVDRASYPAAVSADIVVHRDHRRRGLSIVLFEAARDYLNTSDLIVVFGTPNPKSAPGAIRAGYEVCGTERRYVRILRSQSLLRRRVKAWWLARLLSIPVDWWMRRSIGGEVSVRYRSAITETLDAEVDELWESSRRHFRIVGRRTADWVNWRMAKCPYRDLRFFSVYEAASEQMIGYVTYQTKQEVAAVFDYLARDWETFRVLMDQFVQYHARQSTESIEIVPIDNSSMRTCLKKTGFTARSDGRPFILLFPDNSSHRDVLGDPENWFFTIADNDA